MKSMGYMRSRVSMGSCLVDLSFHYRLRRVLLGRPSRAPRGLAEIWGRSPNAYYHRPEPPRHPS